MRTNCAGLSTPWMQPARVFIAAWAMLAFNLAASPALAEEGKLSKDVEACLKCHDKPHIEKTFDNGQVLMLSISTQDYLLSTHRTLECTDCHSDFDDKTHGKMSTPLKNRRELTKAMQDSCRDCHKKKYTQYEDSIHAVLAKAGNEKAPLCADCHNPHTQRPVKIAAPIEQTPCAKCHGDIFKAYAQDVHGQLRSAEGKTAPTCVDCHQAHDVKAASLGEERKDVCLSCHKNVIAKHEDWLPNAALHFEAISCPVCHAPNAQRRVNLRLFDATSKTQLREKSGVPQFTRRAQAGDAASLGLDERALWSLLAQFNQDKAQLGNIILRGRLEVRSGVEAHQLADKSKAVRDCDSCHDKGSEPFQSVVISIAGSDGRPLRHAVQSDVLNSLTAMKSVRGFYAIGSTRIKLLDWALMLAAGGSLAFVLGHMAIRWMFKDMRERRAAAEAAAAAAKRASGDSGPVVRKLYINPLPIRIWHWINAVGFVALIVTGLQIRYVGQMNLLSFKSAVVSHNWIGFALIANFFIWLGFYLFTDRIKVYHPDLSPTNYFKASWRQLLYYGYGIFRGDPNPFHVSVYQKFNPLQSVMYQVVMMLLVPMQFVTGVLLFDVAPFTTAVDALGGLRVVDTIHALLFIFFCSFIVIHIYLSSLGHNWWTHFEAMISGWEEVEENEAGNAKE